MGCIRDLVLNRSIGQYWPETTLRRVSRLRRFFGEWMITNRSKDTANRRVPRTAGFQLWAQGFSPRS